MIYVLEGPDGCGKTELYKRLETVLQFNSGFHFVKWGPFDADLWIHIEKLEQRDLALFTSMYDRSATYFCDRFCVVSGPVYAQVYNRPIPVYRGPWEPGGLVVCYLRVPVGVAQERLARRGDIAAITDRHVAIHAAYEQWLHGRSTHRHTTHILDGTRSVDALVVDVQRIMRHHGTQRTFA